MTKEDFNNDDTTALISFINLRRDASQIEYLIPKIEREFIVHLLFNDMPFVSEHNMKLSKKENLIHCSMLIDTVKIWQGFLEDETLATVLNKLFVIKKRTSFKKQKMEINTSFELDLIPAPTGPYDVEAVLKYQIDNSTSEDKKTIGDISDGGFINKDIQLNIEDMQEENKDFWKAVADSAKKKFIAAEETEDELRQRGALKYHGHFEDANGVIWTPTQLLLKFIIDKELPLEKYFEMAEEMSKYFAVELRHFEYTEDDNLIDCRNLIAKVIEWENSPGYESLETTLKNLFKIEIIHTV